MKWLVAVLGIVIILLSAVCGILYYQIGDMQSQNSDLQNQIEQLENQLNVLELQNLEQQENISELEDQLNALENATIMVKIIEFKRNETTTNPPAGAGIFSSFYVTVENFGNNDVDGLRVVFNVLYGDLAGNVYNWTVNVEQVHARETRTVKTGFTYGLSRNVVATLMLNDIVLDVATMSVWF